MIHPSTRKFKKWMVISPLGKTIHFGDVRYEDYTVHKDPKRKEAYLRRHQAREDWTNPETAGYWSRWVLWNRPTIEASLKDVIRMIDANK